MTIKEARTVIAAFGSAGGAEHMSALALKLQVSFPALKWGIEHAIGGSATKTVELFTLTVAPHRTRKKGGERAAPAPATSEVGP